MVGDGGVRIDWSNFTSLTNKYCGPQGGNKEISSKITVAGWNKAIV